MELLLIDPQTLAIWQGLAEDGNLESQRLLTRLGVLVPEDAGRPDDGGGNDEEG